MATKTALKRAIFDDDRPAIVIAKEAGIHETRLSKLANGHLEPSDDEKKELARVLGKRVSQLFPEVPA